MNGVIDMLDSYSTSLKYLIASTFVVSYCYIDMEEENKVLKQLKQLYATSLVWIFVNLNCLFSLLNIL